MEKLTEEQVKQLMQQYNMQLRNATQATYAAGKLLENIQEKCPHTSIRKEDKYFRGGYDYRSSIVISEYCEHCGKLLKFYDDPTHQGTFG